MRPCVRWRPPRPPSCWLSTPTASMAAIPPGCTTWASTGWPAERSRSAVAGAPTCWSGSGWTGSTRWDSSTPSTVRCAHFPRARSTWSATTRPSRRQGGCSAMSRDTIDVVLVHPELLGLYGDRGNALALRHRARARDLDVRLVEVVAGEPVPVSADLYLVGGGEDASMVLSHRLLVEDGGLQRALENGAACLAVCAGLQMLSQEFTGPDGAVRRGLGILDVRCPRLTGARAVGEVVVRA